MWIYVYNTSDSTIVFESIFNKLYMVFMGNNADQRLDLEIVLSSSIGRVTISS